MLSVDEWARQPVDLTVRSWQVKQLWAICSRAQGPRSLPTDVARIYLQAERDFPMKGNEEAAGTMYRKALDVGLKKIDATATGTLAARIKKLRRGRPAYL